MSTSSEPSSPITSADRASTEVSVDAVKTEMFTRLENILSGKKPYCSGTLNVQKDELVIFYGKDNATAGRIDFNNASEEDLAHLARAGEPATFGVNQENILDEQYRKSKKIDTAHFSPLFDVNAGNVVHLLRDEFIPEGMQDVDIRIERYKLNVYEPGSFFKPHVDTPRGENMFGSLVIVFPTTHEGGSLVLRDAGKEWVVDSADDMAENPDLCVGYIAFYGDVEHEVLPLMSGIRVTATYNLYYERGPAADYIRSTQDDLYDRLKAAFEELLAIPTILPNGGYLGFGLQRMYGISENTGLGTLVENLKGSDALLLEVCDDLSLSASLRMLYVGDRWEAHPTEAVLCYDVEEMGDDTIEDDILTFIAEDFDGIRISSDPESISEGVKKYRELPDTLIDWVSQDMKRGYISQAYVAYGNEASVGKVYGHVCLIVALGPHGDRLNADGIDCRKPSKEDKQYDRRRWRR